MQKTVNTRNPPPRALNAATGGHKHAMRVWGVVIVLTALTALMYWLWNGLGNGLWNDGLLWLFRQQTLLHRDLARAIRLVSQHGPAAAGSLIALSFAYGIFHAAGPGHGKAVIATYLGTNRVQLKRGLLLSLLSALMQGVTAIVLVEALVGIMGWSLRRAQGAALQLEAVSFGLIALLGAILALRSAWALYHHWREPAPAALFGGGDKGGNHDRAASAFSGSALSGSLSHHNAALRPGPRSHTSKFKAFCADCGGFFQLTREHLKQQLSWRSGLPIVLSIGIRPCTGAVLVLLIAHTLDLRWTGMAAVLAMSIGTALTICLLALAVISLRQGLMHRLQRKARPRVNRIFDALTLAGGLVILLLGLGLLQQALRVVNHPLL